MKKWIKFKIIIVLIVLGFALGACSDYKINATEFIFKQIIDYGVNDEFELTADNLVIGNVLDKTELFFSSSNKDIIEIIGNKFICKSVGEVEIQATIKNIISKEYLTTCTTIKVQEEAITLNNFSLSNEGITMKKGESILAKQYVEFSPVNYINPIIITALDENVVAISNNEITAVGAGSTTVVFSVVDYLTKQEISEILNVDVVDNSVFTVENLIDNKMVFSTLSEGQIKHTFFSGFITRFRFETDSDLIELSQQGDFEVKNKTGIGCIKIHYEIITGEQGVNSYDFEVIAPPSNVYLQQQDFYFTHTLYKLYIEGENLEYNNFIFSDNVEVLSYLINETGIEFEFQFTSKENSLLSVSYKNNYSYTSETKNIFEKQLLLNSKNDIDITFLFNNQTINKDENNTITLYLLNENSENIMHEYYATVSVMVGEEKFFNYQVEISNNDLVYEGNKLKPSGVEGDSTVTITIDNCYTFKQMFTVKKLLVSEITVECDNLYLNSPNNYSSDIIINVDYEYAYNANAISIINLSPDVIEIEDSKVTVKKINTEKKASFQVVCGSIVVKQIIEIDYYITDIVAIFIDNYGDRAVIENNELQIEIGSSPIIIFEVYSGDMKLPTKSINCTIDDSAIVNCYDLEFSAQQQLISNSIGQTKINYNLIDYHLGKTCYQLTVIVY